jgi:hypothetical protein
LRRELEIVLENECSIFSKKDLVLVVIW